MVKLTKFSQILFSLLLIIIITYSWGCSKKTEPKKWHNSLLSLANDTLYFVQAGNGKMIGKMWLSFEDYKNIYHTKIFPNEEMTADLYWRTFIFTFREGGLKRAIGVYKNKNYRVISVKKPKKIREYESFQILGSVEVVLENLDTKEVISDNLLLSSVIKKDNKFQLFKLKKDN